MRNGVIHGLVGFSLVVCGFALQAFEPTKDSVQTMKQNLTGVAVLGFICSLFVPRTGSADPGLTLRFNPVSTTLETLRFARQKRSVFLSLLGISWFWFFGALLLSQFPNYGKNVLGGNEHVVTLLLTVFSVGWPSARCCASACHPGTSRSGWCPSAPSASRCSRRICFLQRRRWARSCGP